jgi:hypothetical protein
VTTTVEFAYHPDGFAVSFAYSPKLVSIIKSTVPSRGRRWNPREKTWTVAPLWADDLATALIENGCRIIGFGVQQAYDDWAKSLFAAVGPARVPAVHRALSKVLHPDNAETGCATLQKQLNTARREVEERRSAEMYNTPPPIEYAGGPDVYSRKALPRRSGRTAAEMTALVAEPGSTLNYGSPREQAAYRRRLLEAMRCGPARTRSGAEARRLTEEAYRSGHVKF